MKGASGQKMSTLRTAAWIPQVVDKMKSTRETENKAAPKENELQITGE
jgi:hypothetical protein